MKIKKNIILYINKDRRDTITNFISHLPVRFFTYMYNIESKTDCYNLIITMKFKIPKQDIDKFNRYILDSLVNYDIKTTKRRTVIY